MFDVENISKTFHHRPVLRDVSFSIKPGERVGLVGPNGAGKTTLLKILASVVQPQRGKAILNNRSMLSGEPQDRKGIIYWGHQSMLYPAFTATENLDFFLKLRGDHYSRERIHQELTRFRLASHRLAAVRTYSAGMLQRVSMARLALSSWQLGFLDEPTSGLDEEGLHLLDQLIGEWQQEKRSILFASHELDWVSTHADRVLVLQNGQIAYNLVQPSREKVLAAFNTPT